MWNIGLVKTNALENDNLLASMPRADKQALYYFALERDDLKLYKKLYMPDHTLIEGASFHLVKIVDWINQTAASRRTVSGEYFLALGDIRATTRKKESVLGNAKKHRVAER